LHDLHINEKIDNCVIAGMGANNIIDILNNKNKQLQIKNFILVPNNDAYLVRK